jgi:MOSC domain-containing protein YiiM
MWRGIVDSIYIAAAAKAPMCRIDSVKANPGSGLEGDRYALGQGTFSKPKPDHELTLIESEAVEAMKRDYGIEMIAGDARRNVVTLGVPLNHLVGCEFLIGEVRVRGIRLCEPCSHLEGLTGQPAIKGLRHRGGLRAQVLSAGIIRRGDVVYACGESERG